MVGFHLCFIPLYHPFFHIWPVSMSQHQQSEVSTSRHNSLSGEKQLSDASVLYCLGWFRVGRGLLFGCLCSAHPLLWNVGISSLVGIFSSLCEFKGAMHNAVQCGVLGWGLCTLAHVWGTVCQLIWSQTGCVCVCVLEEADLCCSAESHSYIVQNKD